MITTILVPRPEPAPSLEAVRAYLAATGWCQGSPGRLWRHPTRDSNILPVAVTTTDLRVIAEMVGHSLAEVVDAIRAHEPAAALPSDPSDLLTPRQRAAMSADLARMANERRAADANLDAIEADAREADSESMAPECLILVRELRLARAVVEAARPAAVNDPRVDGFLAKHKLRAALAAYDAVVRTHDRPTPDRARPRRRRRLHCRRLAGRGAEDAGGRGVRDLAALDINNLDPVKLKDVDHRQLVDLQHEAHEAMIAANNALRTAKRTLRMLEARAKETAATVRLVQREFSARKRERSEKGRDFVGHLRTFMEREVGAERTAQLWRAAGMAVDQDRDTNNTRASSPREGA